MKDIALIIVLLSVGFLILFLLLNSIIDDIFKVKFSRIFLEDLKKAIKYKTLAPQQISTLAESRNLNTRYTVHSVKKAVGDLLTTEDDNLKEIEQLQNYLTYIKQIEPFEGVPSEIRIHLERIKDHSPDLTNLLDPLAIQIKELATVRSREMRLQKYYTVGGFFIGLIGIAVAVWMYINPPQSAPSSTSQTTSEGTSHVQPRGNER